MTAALLAHCREKAFYAYGTARIFAERARILECGRNGITYLGIVLPVLVGGVALSFDTKYLPFVIIPAGFLGLLQLALSVWSLVAKWDDRHLYAVSAMLAQTKLFNAWESLSKRPPIDLDAKVSALDIDDQRQEQSDLAQNISLKEKRYAMRASLYHFGQKCLRCTEVPTSMKAGNCDTCGNF